jgi:imidazoleglycerol-phosphate dehydratase (EC 4.2.1.19)
MIRETKETRVLVELTRGGALSVSTPVPFLAHMVETLLYYAGLGAAWRLERSESWTRGTT